MTKTESEQKNERKNNTRTEDIALFFGALSLCIFVLFAKEATAAATDGIRLCALSIIPSIFPFFVFADFLQSTMSRKKLGVTATLFEKIFGINPDGLSAFICGSICGFPIGAKCAASLYKAGRISKSECERLIGFTNNPSLAFVISGIGVGMKGSLPEGVILYLSVIASGVLTGFLFKDKTGFSKNSREIQEQKFDIVTSIKNAGINSVAVSSYVIFFSTLLGIVRSIVKNDTLTAIFSSFLEIGNAAKYTVKLPGNLSILLLGFSLGFSSLSVHLQAKSMMPPEISFKKYYLMKLLQGILCAAICYTVFTFL